MGQIGVLLWKEWRQMRTLLAGCAVGCVAVLGVTRMEELLQPHDAGVIGYMALIIAGFAICLFASTAIASERRSREWVFLKELPMGATKMLLAKVVMVVALCVALIGLDACTYLLLARGPFVEGVAGISGAVTIALVLFFACLFVSSAVRHPLTAFLTGPVLAAAVLVWLMALLPFRWFEPGASWRYRTSPGTISVPLLVGYVGVCLWLLIATLRIASKKADTLRSPWRVALALVAPLVILGVLLIALHSALFVGWCLSLRPELLRMESLAPSPDGRKILLTSFIDDLGMRAYVVDIESGKAEWLTRFHESMGTRAGVWSPDGRHCLFLEGAISFPPFRSFRGGWQMKSVESQSEIRREALPASYRYGWGSCWWPESDEMAGWRGGASGRQIEPFRYDFRTRTTTWQGAAVAFPADRGPTFLGGPWAVLADENKRTVLLFCNRRASPATYVVPPRSTILSTSSDGSLLRFEAVEKEFDSSLLAGRLSIENPCEDRLMFIPDIVYVYLPTGAGVEALPLDDREWGNCFSPDQRHVLYRVTKEDDKAYGLWLYDMQTGTRERLVSFASCATLRATFSPQGSRLSLQREHGAPPESVTQWTLDIMTKKLVPFSARPNVRGISTFEWLGEDNLVSEIYHAYDSRGGELPVSNCLVRVRWDRTAGDVIFPWRRALTQSEIDVITGNPTSVMGEDELDQP